VDVVEFVNSKISPSQALSASKSATGAANTEKLVIKESLQPLLLFVTVIRAS
jgi:hypothetical protein